MYVVDSAVWCHDTSNVWWYASVIPLSVVINKVFPWVDHCIALISSIKCGSISKEVLDWPQNTSVSSWFALNSLSVSFGVLINSVRLLTHGFIVSAPLRIVTYCNRRSKSVIEPIFLKTNSCPIPCIIKMFRVVWAWETNVMREKNTACNMLITVYSISSKKRFYFVSFTIVSCYIDCIIEFISKFLPFI